MAESKSTPPSAPGKPTTADGRVKHGMVGSPEHSAWGHMKDRCYNPKSQRYDRYGARGIKVCDRWRESFEAFLEDMGVRPSPEHSLERIDNDGDYEPGNCRWATRSEQNRNRSGNVVLEHDGKRMTAAEWARELGINSRTLTLRLEAGWSAEKALTTAVEKREWRDDPKGAEPPKPGDGRYRGTYWDARRGFWLARLWHDGRNIHVGVFNDMLSAAIAHDEAAIRIKGDGAVLNFTDAVRRELKREQSKVAIAADRV